MRNGILYFHTCEHHHITYVMAGNDSVFNANLLFQCKKCCTKKSVILMNVCSKPLCEFIMTLSALTPLLVIFLDFRYTFTTLILSILNVSVLIFSSVKDSVKIGFVCYLLSGDYYVIVEIYTTWLFITSCRTNSIFSVRTSYCSRWVNGKL